MASVLALTAQSSSRTVATAKGDLHYHEAGNGPALVLVHGSGPGVSGWANYGNNLPAFAQHFRCLALDLPGFGRSYATNDNPALTGHDDVVSFLDALGLHEVSLVGNSLGGKIAARVAAAHPERVRRLVTVGGVGMPLFSALPAEGITRLVEFVEEPTRARLLDWMRSMVYDPAVLTEDFVEMRWQAATDPEAMAGIRKIYNRRALTVLRELMLDNAAAEVAMLRQIQAPTLVTWGRDDRVTPLDGALVPMRLLRHGELHVFPRCGHWSMIERKDEFERVVVEFLTRDAADRPAG